jgi:hypothetical protein
MIRDDDGFVVLAAANRRPGSQSSVNRLVFAQQSSCGKFVGEAVSPSRWLPGRFVVGSVPSNHFSLDSTAIAFHQSRNFAPHFGHDFGPPNRPVRIFHKAAITAIAKNAEMKNINRLDAAMGLPPMLPARKSFVSGK